MFFSFGHHDYHIKCAAGFSSHQGFNIDGFKISLKQQEFLNPCCLRTFGISIEIVLFSAYIHTNIYTYISRSEAQLKQRHSKKYLLLGFDEQLWRPLVSVLCSSTEDHPPQRLLLNVSQSQQARLKCEPATSVPAPSRRLHNPSEAASSKSTRVSASGLSRWS